MAVVLRAGRVDAIVTEAKCLALAVEVERSSIICFLLSYAVRAVARIHLGDAGYLEVAAAGDVLAIWMAEATHVHKQKRSAYTSFLHLKPSVRLESIPRDEHHAGLELEGEWHALSQSRPVNLEVCCRWPSFISGRERVST